MSTTRRIAGLLALSALARAPAAAAQGEPGPAPSAPSTAPESAPADPAPAPDAPQPDAESPPEQPGAPPPGASGGPAPSATATPSPADDPASTPDAPPAPAGRPPAGRYSQPGAVTEDEAPAEVTRGPSQAPEPPLPGGVQEPPPPPKPTYRAPRTAFWAGVRGGWLFPFGTLWHDGFLARGACCVYERRTTAGYASSGPLFEIDLGARVGRSYNVFALWERASVGPGDLDPDAFGGQERGWSDLIGVGARFSTNPNDLGLVMEIALGYRLLTLYWADGTKLEMNDGFLDARIGIGADIRVTTWLSLTPMATISSGSFGDGTWSGPDQEGRALDRFDERGQFGTATLQLGGHVDVY